MTPALAITSTVLFEVVMTGLLALAIGIAVGMTIAEMKHAAHRDGRWSNDDWGF